MYIIMPVILLLLNLHGIWCSPLEQVHVKEKAVWEQENDDCWRWAGLYLSQTSYFCALYTQVKTS